MSVNAKTKLGRRDNSSLKMTIDVLQSHDPKSKLGKQMLLRHDSIEALYKAHRAFVEKQFEIAMATASDNPAPLTDGAWVDKVMEFEEVEYELACAICDFCYGEIQAKRGTCWPDLDSQIVMDRIDAGWRHRDAHWKDHPEELAAEERQKVFRKGNRDAAKKLVVGRRRNRPGTG
jgi:hypothetical protein